MTALDVFLKVRATALKALKEFEVEGTTIDSVAYARTRQDINIRATPSIPHYETEICEEAAFPLFFSDTQRHEKPLLIYHYMHTLGFGRDDARDADIKKAVHTAAKAAYDQALQAEKGRSTGRT